METIGLSAFSVLSTQGVSLLAHQKAMEQRKGQSKNNAQTLFGIEQIPTDNRIRAMPISPETVAGNVPAGRVRLEARE